MRRAARQIGLVAAAGLALSSASYGYYHFVHYLTRTAPYTPIYEKFDLNALPNRTVQFYISDQAPTLLAQNDTLQGLYSQIRSAAKVWNGVESSELRVAFGGLGNASSPQSTPAVDVIFDEVPPGLVAMGGPTLKADVAAGPSGVFVPITRSVLVVRRDLSSQPSYGEAFFITLVHEFGHTLGLQHTLTSSVMSTGPTRAATRSKPLATDDLVGLSILYPAQGFAAATGVMTGRVTLGGDGVSLASVVAISPNGPAVSALTNPDGTYRIEGLPAGIQYLVYAHPLPPALPGEVSPANIVMPRDPAGNSLSPGPAFDTIFFPGVKNPSQAFVFTAAAGQTIEGVNFSVQRRAAVSLYAVQTYSFPGPVAVKPATWSRNAARPYVVAAGAGLSVNNAPAPGLGISLIGGAAVVQPTSIKPYAPAPAYVQFDVDFNPFSPEGPYHLVFSLAGDIYVLPAALQMALRPPPVIASVTPAVDAAGGRVAVVTGTNLTSETRFLFDGQPALRVVEDSGRFLATPPPAMAGQRVNVVAVNPDGQSSLFLQANPVIYQYETGDAPVVALFPAALPAGTEALVEVATANGSFIDGQAQLGFSTSDVVVRRSWVASPNRLLANVWVSPAAASQAANITVVNGLQTVTQPAAFQVQPANPRQLTLSSQVVSASTGQASVQAGSIAIIAVGGLTQAQIAAGLSMTVNGVPAQVVNASPGQVAFQIPAAAASGPAVLRLQAGTESSLSIAIAIDLPSPLILSALAGSAPIDGNRPARAAELVTLVVSNLGDNPAPARMRLTVGGLEHQVAMVAPMPNQAGLYQVAFFLNPAVPAGSQPVILTLDGRTSAPFSLPARGQ